MVETEVLGQSHSPEPIHTERNMFWGLIFFLLGVFSFLIFVFAVIISKLLPPFEDKFLSAIQNDRYYCLLVPLTLTVIVVSVYFHWLSMKLFKHA